MMIALDVKLRDHQSYNNAGHLVEYLSVKITPVNLLVAPEERSEDYKIY